MSDDALGTATEAIKRTVKCDTWVTDFLQSSP